MMPRTELIDELIRDGECVAYYDLRKRTRRDLSGNGDPLTLFERTPGVSVVKSKRGYYAPDNTGAHIIIPANAAQNAANDGSFVLFGQYEWNNTSFLVLRSFGVFSLAYINIANTIEFRTAEGTTRHVFVGSRKMLGLNYYSSGSTPPSMYEDGEFGGNFNNVRNVSLTNANMGVLGFNNASAGTDPENIFEGLFWTNRRLTAQEHRQIYRELHEL